MRTWIPWRIAGGVCALVALASATAIAADHNEAPGTKADPIADIDDVYAWHDSGKIVVVLTFSGPGANAAAAPPEFDPGVLYGIHVDNDGDYVAEHDVWARFGEASDGTWGVQLTGIPGATGTVVGAVGAQLDAGDGLRAQAGVFDDPFFFDFTGFQNTLSTGSVAFDSTRDSFAGKNVNAIVFEMDADAARGAANTVRVWATTGRK